MQVDRQESVGGGTLDHEDQKQNNEQPERTGYDQFPYYFINPCHIITFKTGKGRFYKIFHLEFISAINRKTLAEAISNPPEADWFAPPEADKPRAD